jgi:transcriptional regulator with XRE-family HTH domain
MGIKDILDRLITEKGISVRELSRKTGVSHQSIHGILNGDIDRPHRRTIKRLADYFGVPPDYLLYGNGETEVPKNDVANLRSRVDELERRLYGKGTGLRDVQIGPDQAEFIKTKYRDVILALRGEGDLTPRREAILIRLLWVWDEITKENNRAREDPDKPPL